MTEQFPDILILCGGRGTRLQAAVADRQKCVAEVGGEPFLVQLIRYCAGFGARRFILCSGHLAETVESAVRGLPDEYKIVHSPEAVPLGTGGAIRDGLKLASTPLTLVLNGDSFCPFSLPGLLAFHCRKTAELTMLLTAPDTRADTGIVRLGPTGRVIAFAEKCGTMADPGLVNAGVYLIETGLAAAFPQHNPLSLEKEVIPAFLTGRRVFGLQVPGPLLDIGTPERLTAARRLFAESATIAPGRPAGRE